MCNGWTFTFPRTVTIQLQPFPCEFGSQKVLTDRNLALKYPYWPGIGSQKLDSKAYQGFITLELILDSLHLIKKGYSLLGSVQL